MFIPRINWAYVMVVALIVILAGSVIADAAKEQNESTQYAEVVDQSKLNAAISDPAILLLANDILKTKGATTQSADAEGRGEFVVRDASTGRIGVAIGKLLVTYRDGANLQNIATDYGLDVVDTFQRLSTGVLAINSFAHYLEVKAALELDYRVKEVKLEVIFDQAVLQ